MTFTDPNFLLFFLPILLIIYFISKQEFQLIIILLSSILFFAINNVLYLPLIFVLIWLNFFLGKQIAGAEELKKKSPLFIGIIINISFLFLFKLTNSVNIGYPTSFEFMGVSEFIRNIGLPLGFSYITFQNISYLIDVKNEICDVETKYLNYAIYTLFFPKIIVGPIMRYGEMISGIKNPKINISQATEGLRRFIIGLAKKALIADTIARVINPSFDLQTPEFSTGIAWFMIIGFAIQLYFDFSGFTDMAIGLGQMMGISLIENFNFPYIAESLSDFWRRWHISLSSWARDYIFTPLEFKRRHVKFARQQTHIIVAFLVIGLWHGLTPNYVVWGLLNGIFLALEMTFLAKVLKRSWKPFRHLYTLIVVLVTWVFFKSNTLTFAIKFLGRLIGIGDAIPLQPYSLSSPLPIIDNSVWLALVLGIIFSIPILPKFSKKIRTPSSNVVFHTIGYVVYDFLIVSLLILSIASLTSSSMVRNIYGGF
jgi:alginate O-acetyltransferase complex protein AlgI